MPWSLSRDQLVRALDNPIRLQILLVARKLPPGCSASSVKRVLWSDFKEELETRKVKYHLARLQDVGLLPRPLPPGG
jgi:DNA-binding transcriptional ArsR family regulator